jgi:glycosyltransferase involved in cell wall biosynthesis
MRYAWENCHNYINQYQTNSFVKRCAKFFIHKIRIWDRLSADRVDNFIANSSHVQQRIFKYYRKPSTVIHPFVEIKDYIVGGKRDKFFLAVGRLTPYKRFDLVIDAFNESGLPLKIAGTGVSLNSLKRKAKDNIEFLGHVTDNKLRELYGRARGLIFPQVEDFGIIPLEAMATGCPVIAYSKGGALETIIDGKTGIFFHQQTSEALRHAVYKFFKTDFDPNTIRKQAEKFDREIFNKKLLEFLEHKWQHHLTN